MNDEVANDKAVLRKTQNFREVIPCKVWRGQQSANLESFWETIHGHKVKIRIKRDTYIFQSLAAAHVLMPNGWHVLVVIPYPHINTLESCGANEASPLTQDQFSADEAQLLAEAAALLGALPPPADKVDGRTVAIDAVPFEE